MDYLLCPYYSICYHLKKQAVARKKPINKEKLFNFCHSSLWNIIKKIFIVTKQYFQIFKFAPEYNFATQIHLVFEVTVLHNFISKHQSQEDIYVREKLLAKRKNREKNSKDNIEIKVNLAKRDRKKINKYQEKMIKQIW